MTDDAIRSLAISQRLLGTKEIILIHHTDCGMLTFSDDDVKAQIERTPASVHRSRWSHSPMSTTTCVSRSRAMNTSPFVPEKSHVRGFVYDVKTGRLREVT